MALCSVEDQAQSFMLARRALCQLSCARSHGFVQENLLILLTDDSFPTPYLVWWLSLQTNVHSQGTQGSVDSPRVGGVLGSLQLWALLLTTEALFRGTQMGFLGCSVLWSGTWGTASRILHVWKAFICVTVVTPLSAASSQEWPLVFRQKNVEKLEENVLLIIFYELAFWTECVLFTFVVVCMTLHTRVTRCETLFHREHSNTPAPLLQEQVKVFLSVICS